MSKIFSHEGKKVYVAGHTGLAGSAIVRRLEESASKILKVSHSELDLTNQKAVQDWFKHNRPDVVYLAAATAGGIHANYEKPAEFIYNNLAIQNNIINSSYEYGVEKLCFLGSSCIYPRLAQQPMQESSLLKGPLDKHNIWYAVAKIAGLMTIDGYSKQYGCKYISVMPANLYGPGDKYTEKNSHVVAALIKRFHECKILKRSEIEVWGTGKAMREFLHCDDMADACVFVMEKVNNKKTEQTHINIGTGEEISIKDLAVLIKKRIGFKGSLLFNTSKPDGTMRKVTDVTKIHSLGWKHTVALEEGIDKMYEWYKRYQNKKQ